MARYQRSALARCHQPPFKPCLRFPDDLLGVACVGYFTVPINLCSPYRKLIAGQWCALRGPLSSPPILPAAKHGRQFRNDLLHIFPAIPLVRDLSDTIREVSLSPSAKATSAYNTCPALFGYSSSCESCILGIRSPPCRVSSPPTASSLDAALIRAGPLPARSAAALPWPVIPSLRRPSTVGLTSIPFDPKIRSFTNSIRVSFWVSSPPSLVLYFNFAVMKALAFCRSPFLRIALLRPLPQDPSFCIFLPCFVNSLVDDDRVEVIRKLPRLPVAFAVGHFPF